MKNRSCMLSIAFVFVFVRTCLRLCKCVYECVFTNVMIRIVSLVPFLFDLILFPIVLSLPYDFTICLQLGKKRDTQRPKYTCKTAPLLSLTIDTISFRCALWVLSYFVPRIVIIIVAVFVVAVFFFSSLCVFFSSYFLYHSLFYLSATP